jgi:surface antigen/peptidoglycan hydrolase CwlO-like protein
MPKQKSVRSTIVKFRAAVLVLAALVVVGGAGMIAHADRFDEQINALNAQNADAQSQINGLQAQADSYQDAINKLGAQIAALQAALGANEARQASVQQQIDEAKNKIETERKYLAEDIRLMYVDGQLSTIEELATSKSLSEYVDKETYRTSVQNKINGRIKEIADLQAQLQKQKQELDVLIASQQQQNAELGSAQAQQQQMLAYNEGQQAAYNSQIGANRSKIAELRRQQIAANARFIGGGTSFGGTCGGGYPGKWCNIPQDSAIDDWGMYNRECVSYTAFRVAASGRYMPYWGGRGNANQWDDNARAAGIPVDGNPQPGDVAISNGGFYGHAMYVESVNGDGTINISQYNAGLDGRYSTRSGLSTYGLVFIHF